MNLLVASVTSTMWGSLPWGTQRCIKKKFKKNFPLVSIFSGLTHDFADAAHSSCTTVLVIITIVEIILANSFLLNGKPANFGMLWISLSVKKQPSQDVLHGDAAEEELGLACLVSSYTLPHQNSQPGERGQQTARSKVLSRRARDTWSVMWRTSGPCLYPA